MSIPTAVFLDTCILRAHSYDFSAPALSTFVPACKQRDIKLLLPDPTEREVKRQMKELSGEAANLVEKARRTAPFLAKWKGFPQGDTPKWEASRVRNIEWATFLKQFDVVRLNYDGVAIANVMSWYDAALAPFDGGKKRKEFPDAFAVAILALYAERHGCYVAVVSHDLDLKKACERFSALMYFHSLPVLTELLLSAEDSRIAEFRSVLDTPTCNRAVADAAQGASITLRFYHGNDYSEIVNSDIKGLDIADMRIVAIGEHECTVAFDAVVRVLHDVEWYEPAGAQGEMETKGETVRRDYDVSGTAKLLMDAKTKTLLDIPVVTLNEDELEATDLPPFWDRWR
jgi:hypothetical protein